MLCSRVHSLRPPVSKTLSCIILLYTLVTRCKENLLIAGGNHKVCMAVYIHVRSLYMISGVCLQGHYKVVKYLVDHVSQFPSDAELTRYINTLSDKVFTSHHMGCVWIVIETYRHIPQWLLTSVSLTQNSQGGIRFTSCIATVHTHNYTCECEFKKWYNCG